MTLDCNYYKKFNNVLQEINLFKDIDTFFFKYKTYEGCSICTKAKEYIKFLSPCIELSKESLLSKINIESLIRLKLSNYNCACPKCGYKNQNIISQTYFKIINEIIPPSFIFINFEFLNETHVNLRTNLEVELETYNIRIKYNKEIIDYLFEPKNIFGYEYNIIGVINTPESDHYNSIIINLYRKYKSLIINNNYIYDSLHYVAEIKLINDLNKELYNNNPYIGIYVQKNLII